MGKLQDFNIEVFDNPLLVYYAGQSVTGRVTFTLSAAKKCRGVSVTLLGESKVRWVEHNHGSNERRRRRRTYHNSETYFKERIIFFGSGPETSGNNVEIPEGHHEFPFQYILPQNIPNSFKGLHGSVEYSLKAVIDKALGFDNECEVPLEIIDAVNLNNIPEAQMPVQKGATKHFCCCCCKSGPLSAMVRLDRKGYEPGRKMPISAEITNLTNRNISKTKATIEMHVKYHAISKTKHSTTEIAHLEKGPIKKGGSDFWNGELLEIPPTPPSKLEHCKIIDIRYTLNFSICCHGAMDLDISLPIIIGTQSFDSDFDYLFQ